MSIQDNNLSAFHVLERGGNGLELTDAGMTLRDYFAAQILPTLYEIYLHHQSYEAGWLGDVAKIAYQLADEMLEARKLGKE